MCEVRGVVPAFLRRRRTFFAGGGEVFVFFIDFKLAIVAER